MKIRIDGRMVDVKDARCADRECFSLGFDKGSFSQGRGYTSYHTDANGKRVERPVCMTRQLRGCPTLSVCPECRLCSVDPPGARCEQFDCGTLTVARAAKVQS